MSLEQIDLRNYEVGGILGAGADYEVRAAAEIDTGKQVVLKRPKPQMVSRQLHQGIEARTDRVLQAYQDVGHTIATVVPVLGYSQRTNHDLYFGESLGQEYRVVVEERARGVPLVGDPMARVTGVPIGVGQNLFTLFPLIQPPGQATFGIHRQLLDLEEGFNTAGYVLLDLRPQNIFYQPSSDRITVIDCGGLVGKEDESYSTRRPPQDIHDFYLEMLKFYTTPLEPPTSVDGYREPHGLRPVVRFEQELDEMARRFGEMPAPSHDAALTTIDNVRNKKYTDIDGFRKDLIACLEAIAERNRGLPQVNQMREAWCEALEWLRQEYWQRFLFDPDVELSPFYKQ